MKINNHQLLKAILKILIGFLISGIAIYYLVSNIEQPDKIWNSILSADYLYIIIGLFLPIIAQILRALRWQYLMSPIKKVSIHSLFSSTNIGFMVNNLLPLRIGEIVRPTFLGIKESTKISASFATIVTERIIDLFSILIIFLIVSSQINLKNLSPHLAKSLKIGAYLSFLVCLLGFIVILFCHRWNDSILKFIERSISVISIKLSKLIINITKSFMKGLQTIKFNRGLIFIILYSIIIWSISSSLIYFMNIAFKNSMHVTLNFIDSFLILVAIAFAVSIPSSPGFLGVYHYAYTITLVEVYHVNYEVALSTSIVTHAIIMITQIFLGIFYVIYDWEVFVKITKILKKLLLGELSLSQIISEEET